MKRITVAAAILAALGAAGCAKVVSPTENQVQTVDGTVFVRAGAAGMSHGFTVGAPGEFTLTMTSLSPPPPDPNTYPVAAQIYFGRDCSGGLWFSGSNLVGQPLLSRAIVAGGYCIVVVNPGWFTTDENYRLELRHP